MADRSNGSPYDRGSSDRYYGRSANPHKWVKGVVGDVPLTDIEEIREYHKGFDEEDDKKDWR